MRNRLIYICSPLRGDIEKNIQKAQGYCREAVDLWPDVIPIAPHVYCTQFLDDTIPQEREADPEAAGRLIPGKDFDPVTGEIYEPEDDRRTTDGQTEEQPKNDGKIVVMERAAAQA